MIPKVIHFCWFGGKQKPALVKKCINSWRHFAPDYRIIQWSEKNFDYNSLPYAAYCYNNQKYAFLTDYVRLEIIFRYGGIYLDTDVELVKSFDSLLEYEAFYGFENEKYVATGLGFGAEKNHVTVGHMLEKYYELKSGYEGNFPMIPCPELNTNALMDLGLIRNGKRQNVMGAEILPVEYLNPYDDPTGVLSVTDSTLSIHWYGKSWMPTRKKLRNRLTRPLHRILGVDFFRKHIKE